jgi:hypothetical protein
MKVKSIFKDTVSSRTAGLILALLLVITVFHYYLYNYQNTHLSQQHDEMTDIYTASVWYDIEGAISLSSTAAKLNAKNVADNISHQIELDYPDINELKEERNCIICLDDFEQNDILVYLPCFHYFHKDCIFRWIKRNAICPFCHLDIKENLNINPY